MARDVLRSVEVVDVEILNRLRTPDSEAVARLAASMRQHGLQNPITVRMAPLPPDDEFPGGGNGIVLVAGLHRLEAARLLGWTDIDCTWFEGDDRAAEMWEIAENLHRCDLTKAQRDIWVRRYAELMENTRPDCPSIPVGPGQPKSIATKIAEETGLSDRTVRRILAPPKPQEAPAAPPQTAPEPGAEPEPPAADIPGPISDNELIRRPKPDQTSAEQLAEAERDRAAEYLAGLLSEFSQDQHAAISSALDLAPGVDNIAKHFKKASAELYGAKSS